MNTTTTHPQASSRAPIKPLSKRSAPKIPPLVNGDKLSSEEFLRRYEASPDIKKAELIDGIVYIMASPVYAKNHGDPDNLMQWILREYKIGTPGVASSTNSTIVINSIQTPQPDASLRYLPERSGREQFDEKGQLAFPPELVVEVAATSAAIDLHKKRDDYLRAGVQEYIVWCTETDELRWWYLANGDYKPLTADVDGFLRSRIFPGFWLEPAAVFAQNEERMRAVLNLGLQSPEHAAFVALIKK